MAIFCYVDGLYNICHYIHGKFERHTGNSTYLSFQKTPKPTPADTP